MFQKIKIIVKDRIMKKLLICIDVQNSFIDGELGSEQAKNIVPNVVKKIEEFNNGLIITTQDTHYDNYMDTPEGKYLPVPHCIAGTDGWKINDDIQDAINQRIAIDGVSSMNIKKPTFGSMSLANFIDSYVRSLDENEDVNIEICGIVSSICVISNALLIKTMLYDLNRVTISVIKDCCAGLNDYNHEAAMEVMKSCQINVI